MQCILHSSLFLQKKGDEIDSLKEQNRISEARYLELHQKLNEEQESNKRIAGEKQRVRESFDHWKVTKKEEKMNIPHFNQCVTFALRVNCIKGDNLKETNLRVFEREVANPNTVFKALRKGGLIFPAVSQSLFEGDDHSPCATYLLNMDEERQEVSLYHAMRDEVV